MLSSSRHPCSGARTGAGHRHDQRRRCLKTGARVTARHANQRFGIEPALAGGASKPDGDLIEERCTARLPVLARHAAMVEAVGEQHENSLAVDASSQRLHQPGRGVRRPHQNWCRLMGKQRLAFGASGLDQVLKDSFDHAHHFKRKLPTWAMAARTATVNRRRSGTP